MIRRCKIVNISPISAHTVSTIVVTCVARRGWDGDEAVRRSPRGCRHQRIRGVPGVIASDMTGAGWHDNLIEEGLTPIRRWGEPSDVGKAVLALAQDAFPFTTGEVINVDGGFTIRRI